MQLWFVSDLVVVLLKTKTKQTKHLCCEKNDAPVSVSASEDLESTAGTYCRGRLSHCSLPHFRHKTLILKFSHASIIGINMENTKRLFWVLTE